MATPTYEIQRIGDQYVPVLKPSSQQQTGSHMSAGALC
jgi:hypothetical protein